MELVAPLNHLFQADTLVYPINIEVQNACGRWGALVACILFTGLGVGAYYLVGSLAAVDVLLLMRRPIDSPIVRSLGWCVSLAGLTALLALVVPSLSPGPVIGSGGYLGALGAGLLEIHFALVGGLILATACILGGLLLCTDYALMRAVYWTVCLGATSIANGRNAVRSRRGGADKDEEEADQEELSVRIRGRVVADEDEEEYEEEELADDSEETEEPEEEEEEEAEREPVVKAKAAKAEKKPAETPLRIRNRADKKKSNERQEVMQRLDEASLERDAQDYELPSLDLLLEANDVCFEEQAREVRRKAKILERTFANFGFQVKVVEIETGPVIAQYEVELEAGLRLSRITGLADDLAIALRVPSVRIVAPIPGKNTVGIEVPNDARQVVRLREVMEETNGRIRKMQIPLFLGKDVSGNSLTVDLAKLPHLLIAGRTGTGKSVCLNAIISSILMTRRPDEVRMLMIDPKMVELSGYGRLPHLMHPVVTDMRKAEAILAWAVEKMEERYSLLARAGVRHISSYNQLGREELAQRLQVETDEEREAIPDHLPYIVIVADEIADMMMTAGKEVEQHIIRLAQKSRAVGIHLILATQKPTVDVITGLIKSNLPARISFQVASRTDSRVVLDEMGADKLLGNGDMLFLWPGTSTLLRGQGTYLSDEEINSVVDIVSTGEQNFVNELVNMKVENAEDPAAPEQLRKRDDLYESAIDVVVREGRGSVSLLQRTLGIGYGRAARLIDFMAEDGIVGDYNGSQAREVIISVADWERMQGLEGSEEQPVEKEKPRRSNVILPEPDAEDDATVEDPDIDEPDASLDEDLVEEQEEAWDEPWDEEDVDEEPEEVAADEDVDDEEDEEEEEADDEEEYEDIDVVDEDDDEYDEEYEDEAEEYDDDELDEDEYEEEEEALDEDGEDEYEEEDEEEYEDADQYEKA